MITTQAEAKRFLVDKIVAQAQTEGVLLTAAERQMILWSESDPDIKIDPTLPQRLEAEISDDEYERKIVGLLTRSFAADVRANPQAEDQWKHVSTVLHQGDHYVLVMLDEAVGHRWKTWWQRFLGT
jgi:hypothetical protein